MDAALIQQCADPSLKPAIVEQFIEAAGAPDPLMVNVRMGNRVILVPKARTPDEVLAIVRDNVGRAVVRVGLTQFPAGVGLKDASEVKDDLVDPCENLRKGTSMFAKILRIVAKWYGNPKSDEVFPQIFEDAVYAWKTGEFEGQSVFQAADPGGQLPDQTRVPENTQENNDVSDAEPSSAEGQPEADEAGIRIDLSRINGK